MKVTLKSLSGLFLVLSLFTLVPGALSAQNFTAEERAYIQSAPVISLAYISTRAPYSYITDDGSIDGISVELMERISVMSGLTFTHSAMKYGQRTIDYLDEHTADLVVGVMTDNPQFKSPAYEISDPYFSDSVALVARKNRQFENFGADSEYTMIIPRGYAALESYVEEHYPLFHILYCFDTDEGLNAVMNGHADFFVQNMTVISNELSRPQYTRLGLLPSVFMDERMSVVGCASPDTRIIISIINKCIAELDATMMKEMVLVHTMATAYRLKFFDVIYMYRIQFMVLLLLIGISIFLFVSYLMQKDRHYTEIAEMNTRLMFATEQAHEAAQAKSRFLLRISHDIRTPMNAIMGSADYMELLERRNDAGIEERLEAIGRIRSATVGMERLVDDIITRANYLEGNLELKNDPFNPGDLIKAAADELQMTVSGRVNWVSVSIAPELGLRVFGDSGQVTELLDLLVEWVVCFPYPLRSLILSAKLHRFDDTRVFSQVSISLVTSRPVNTMEENEARRNHIENLADALGGSASFELHNEICVDISVTLPLNLTAERLSPSDPAQNDGVADLMQFRSSRPLSILVVDDNEVNVLIVQNLLKACGITSTAVYNGREGVHAFESAPPGTYQAILMDIRMPVMNGNDATRAIRNSNRTDGHDIPIFAFSANYATTDIASSINAGVNGYLKKPLDVQKLLQVLKSLS